MRTILSAATAAFFITAAGSAYAASLTEPSVKDDLADAEPVQYYAPIWSGFYFGGFGAFAWADAYHEEKGGGGPPPGVPGEGPPGLPAFDGKVERQPFDLDGGLFGVQIGYDFQVDHYVFGIVGDYFWGDLKDSFVPGQGNAPITRRAEISSLATLRGRLGYAFDHWLVYGTAGIAFVDAEIGSTLPRDNDPVRGPFKDDFSAWVIGAGFEKQLGHGISFFAEYLYVGLDDEILTDDGESSGFDGPVVFDDISILKAGLNIRLGEEERPIPLK
jgi:outer membrane immunogenic protein